MKSEVYLLMTQIFYLHLRITTHWISSEVMLCGDSSDDVIIVIIQSLISLGGRGHHHRDGQVISCSQSRVERKYQSVSIS